MAQWIFFLSKNLEMVSCVRTGPEQHGAIRLDRKPRICLTRLPYHQRMLARLQRIGAHLRCIDIVPAPDPSNQEDII